MGGFSFQLVGIAVFVLLGAAGGVVYLLRHRSKKEEQDRSELSELQKVGLHLPPSLHPIIDPDICIGSLACLRACPEGEILGLVDGAAKLIHGAKCIGHGRCADECPVDAIRLVFGTSERGLDLPQLGPHFESTRKGIHVVGELGGMGLIKNAIRQGIEVGEHLASTLGKGEGPGRDVAIIGAGPAGIGTAAALAHAGLSFEVFDQDSVGGTVAHYPRQKLVMTETVSIPGYGRFGKAQMLKEEVIAAFEDILGKVGIRVWEGTKVAAIRGEAGSFQIETSRGSMPARAVVMAIGRRGTPRKLGVPGEELSKVAYRLIDPTQYDGKRMLVVGGGDSALESAIMLAEESDAEVAISYRREVFGRCRPKNKERIAALIEAGLVVPFMSSSIESIEPGHVTIRVGEKPVRLANDFVVVNAGGELPTKFLEEQGVSVRTHRGEDRGAAPGRDLEGGDVLNRRLEFILFGLGLLITATLTAVGWEYYLLPEAARDSSPLHDALRPSGWWGHGVGVIATAVMLLNFVYAARKRWGFMRRTGSIRSWLTFHLFVGFLSPVVIGFHAAFKSNNLLATVTLASLLVVVGTGILGRFIWGMVPSTKGKAVELSELQERWNRHLARIRSLTGEASDPTALRGLLRWATREPPDHGSLFLHLLSLPAEHLRAREGLSRVRPLFSDAGLFAAFAQALHRLIRLRVQVGFYRSLRRLLSAWRAFHVVLAVLMVFVIAAHIAVSLLLGYGWILF